MTLLLVSGYVGASRTLKRHFAPADEALEDLKIARIDTQYQARDEHGSMLVWVGDAETPPSSALPAPQPAIQEAGVPQTTPAAATPAH